MSYQVYRHFDSEGLLLYVGCSLNALARLAGHKQCSEWFPQIATISIEHFASKREAMDAEHNAILFERPKFNKNGPTGNNDAAAEVLGVTAEEVRQFFKRPQGIKQLSGKFGKFPPTIG